MGFYDKFELLCKSRMVTPTKAATEMGFSSAMPTKWAKGSMPTGKTLNKIAEHFGVDVAYFYEEIKKEPVTTQALGSLIMMPVIGNVRAGQGLTAMEEYTGEYMGIPVDAVHNNPGDYRILSVVGDSMYPIFIEGIDKLIVHISDFSLINGCYVVAILRNGDGVVKKLHILENGDYELISINPMYAPIRMDQIERIYGVVHRSERVFI